jgi:hypothetical protein
MACNKLRFLVEAHQQLMQQLVNWLQKHTSSLHPAVLVS